MTDRLVGISALLRRACAAVVVAALAGCGGGGDGDTSGAVGGIGGTGFKGPVGGATVTAYAIDNGTMGSPIASAMTDAQGNFNLSMGAYAGAVMLRLAGGTYTDEATGAAMPMATGDVMTAALPSMAAGAMITGVQLTPLTSMAQAAAQRMAGGMTDANIATANAAVGTYFMVGDILRTPPMDPLVTGSGSAATPSSMNYGMTLAAMSRYAKSIGMTPSSAVVTAMMQDASDGIMDGRMAGNPIAMGGGMMGGSMMQPGAGTTGLGSAMADFVTSVFNRSGRTAADMAPLMQRLGASDGRIH